MTKPLQSVLTSGDFGFADCPQALEELAPLDDLFAHRPAGKEAPSMHAIRPDGLVAGSCGPLSRSPEPGSPGPFRGTWGGEHLVGYGFLASEADCSGLWHFSPEQLFRATRVYAWAHDGATVSIDALRFDGQDEIIGGHSLSADLLASWVSPKQFFELYARVQAPPPGNHRVLLRHMPGQPSILAPLRFPTLEPGMPFEVAWTGPLHAFFVCGRELLPAEGRKGRQGSQGSQGSQGEKESEVRPGHIAHDLSLESIDSPPPLPKRS